MKIEHLFYETWESLSLDIAYYNEYRVLETRVVQQFEDDDALLVFSHLVELI